MITNMLFWAAFVFKPFATLCHIKQWKIAQIENYFVRVAAVKIELLVTFGRSDFLYSAL